MTVSLHTLDDQVFGHMNGRGLRNGRVLEGIRAAEEAGLTPIKINVVVQKGVNEHTIVDLTRRVKEMGHILRFIEYMDVGNLNQWDSDEVVTSQEVIELIGREMPLEPADKSYRGEVADRYRYADGEGEIGSSLPLAARSAGTAPGPASRRRGRFTLAFLRRKGMICEGRSGPRQ